MNNNSKNKYPDLLDLNQVTEYLSLSKSHIYKLTNKNGIPFSKQGKKLYFDKEVITLWALENKNAVQEEIQQKANEYLLKKGLKNRKNN